MNYSDLAQKIINDVGGEKNIEELTHCATRLRFNLKDMSKVNEEKLKKTSGVMGIAQKGGQFQVIIGSDVDKVFNEILTRENITQSSKKEKGKVLDIISGIFTPILPAITGAGMLKAFLVLLTALNLISENSQTYYIFNFIADAAFYFLPVMIAITASQKFKTNMFLSVTIAGVLLHPNLSALVSLGEPVRFIGLPMTLASYGSTVVPIILAVWLLSYVEKFADIVSPKSMKFFTKPLLIILIVSPITLIAIGPLGIILGNFLANIFSWMTLYLGWLSIPLMAIFVPFIVMTGMHYAFTPITVAAFAKNGYDPLSFPGMLCSNIAQGGAALAVAFKTKDRDLKQLASSAGITALFGITEPAMFGVNLRLKKPMVGAMIGAGVSGVYAGISVLKAYANATPGLASLAMFIGGEGYKNIINAVITLVIALVVSFIATLVIGFEDISNEEVYKENYEENEVNVEALDKTIKIKSPLKGEVVKLSKVNDITFSQEIIGKGIAIKPTEGKVVSPINGTVSAIFNTKHAIGLISDEGVEILIHVGLDTVKLEGKYFESYVKAGDKVKVNDLLVEFDIDAIENEGYETVTPVIITNHAKYLDVVSREIKEVDMGEDLITII